MSDAKRLMQIIGPELMERVCSAFGGERVYIPHRMHDESRDEYVQTLFTETVQSGATCMSAYRRAADEVGLSVRRVQDIVAGRV